MADTDNDGKPRSDGSGDASGGERRSPATPEAASEAIGEDKPAPVNTPATEAGPPPERNSRPAPEESHQAASEDGPAPVREEEPGRTAHETPEPTPAEHAAEQSGPAPDKNPAPLRPGLRPRRAPGEGEPAGPRPPPAPPATRTTPARARATNRRTPSGSPRPRPTRPDPRPPIPLGQGPARQARTPAPGGRRHPDGPPLRRARLRRPQLVPGRRAHHLGLRRPARPRAARSSGPRRYLVSLFFAVAFYASVLIHELAHTVAALRFNLPVRRIQLQFFGGVSEIEKESDTPGREFVLAFVGPLLSLVLAGVFYARNARGRARHRARRAARRADDQQPDRRRLQPAARPAARRRPDAARRGVEDQRQADGRHRRRRLGRPGAGRRRADRPPAAVLRRRGRKGRASSGIDSLTDALLAAILAAIIWTGAGNSLRMARLRERLPELRARNLTRRAVPVQTDTPLSEALRRANEAGARALVVVDGRGEPLALVREARHRRSARTPPPLGRGQRPRPGPQARHAGLRPNWPARNCWTPCAPPPPPNTSWSSPPARSTACCPPPTSSAPSSRPWPSPRA